MIQQKPKRHYQTKFRKSITQYHLCKVCGSVSLHPLYCSVPCKTRYIQKSKHCEICNKEFYHYPPSLRCDSCRNRSFAMERQCTKCKKTIVALHKGQVLCHDCLKERNKKIVEQKKRKVEKMNKELPYITNDGICTIGDFVLHRIPFYVFVKKDKKSRGVPCALPKEYKVVIDPIEHKPRVAKIKQVKNV
jgi:hypothetical protein